MVLIGLMYGGLFDEVMACEDSLTLIFNSEIESKDFPVGRRLHLNAIRLVI